MGPVADMSMLDKDQRKETKVLELEDIQKGLCGTRQRFAGRDRLEERGLCLCLLVPKDGQSTGFTGLNITCSIISIYLGSNEFYGQGSP
jgi:hypothetical protein